MHANVRWEHGPVRLLELGQLLGAVRRRRQNASVMGVEYWTVRAHL